MLHGVKRGGAYEGNRRRCATVGSGSRPNGTAGPPDLGRRIARSTLPISRAPHRPTILTRARLAKGRARTGVARMRCPAMRVLRQISLSEDSTTPKPLPNTNALTSACEPTLSSTFSAPYAQLARTRHNGCTIARVRALGRAARQPAARTHVVEATVRI